MCALFNRPSIPDPIDHGPHVTLDSVVPTRAVGRLLLVAGEGHLGMHPLIDGQTLIVGRDVQSDVKLAHRTISRRHALIHAGASVEVEDIGSKNGVRLAGRRLTRGERAAVELGISMRLGPYVAVVLDATDGADREAA
jgi:hypothetical protein